MLKVLVKSYVHINYLKIPMGQTDFYLVIFHIKTEALSPYLGGELRHAGRFELKRLKSALFVILRMKNMLYCHVHYMQICDPIHTVKQVKLFQISTFYLMM